MADFSLSIGTIQQPVKFDSHQIRMNIIPQQDDTISVSTESSYSSFSENSSHHNAHDGVEPSGRCFESDSSESSYLEDEVQGDGDTQSSNASSNKLDGDCPSDSLDEQNRERNYRNSGWDTSMRSTAESTIASAISRYSADGKSHISTLLTERQSQQATTLLSCEGTTDPPTQQSHHRLPPNMMQNARNNNLLPYSSNNTNQSRYLEIAAESKSGQGLLSIDLHRPIGLMPNLNSTDRNTERRHSLDALPHYSKPHQQPSSELMDQSIRSNPSLTNHTMSPSAANIHRSVRLDMAPLRDGGTSFYSNMAASNNNTSSSLNIDLFRSVGLPGLDANSGPGRRTRSNSLGMAPPRSAGVNSLYSSDLTTNTTDDARRRREKTMKGASYRSRRRRRSKSVDLAPTHPRAATGRSNNNIPLLDRRLDEGTKVKGLHLRRPSQDMAPTNPRDYGGAYSLGNCRFDPDATVVSTHLHSSHHSLLDPAPSAYRLDKNSPRSAAAALGLSHARRPSFDCAPVHPRAKHKNVSSSSSSQLYRDTILDQEENDGAEKKSRLFRRHSFDLAPTHPRARNVLLKNPPLSSLRNAKLMLDDFTVRSSSSSSSAERQLEQNKAVGKSEEGDDSGYLSGDVSLRRYVRDSTWNPNSFSALKDSGYESDSETQEDSKQVAPTKDFINESRCRPPENSDACVGDLFPPILNLTIELNHTETDALAPNKSPPLTLAPLGLDPQGSSLEHLQMEPRKDPNETPQARRDVTRSERLRRAQRRSFDNSISSTSVESRTNRKWRECLERHAVLLTRTTGLSSTGPRLRSSRSTLSLPVSQGREEPT